MTTSFWARVGEGEYWLQPSGALMSMSSTPGALNSEQLYWLPLITGLSAQVPMVSVFAVVFRAEVFWIVRGTLLRAHCSWISRSSSARAVLATNVSRNPDNVRH